MPGVGNEEIRVIKKPRLVFTDIQRRTLHAIFKETKRPSKEMQVCRSHYFTPSQHRLSLSGVDKVPH